MIKTPMSANNAAGAGLFPLAEAEVRCAHLEIGRQIGYYDA
jgi:hypothetical protein